VSDCLGVFGWRLLLSGLAMGRPLSEALLMAPDVGLFFNFFGSRMAGKIEDKILA
jgi:hypothetical protein